MSTRPNRFDLFISGLDPQDPRLEGIYYQQSLLRSRGYYCEIFVEHYTRLGRKDTHPMESYENFATDGAASIYHHTHASRIPDFLLAFSTYKISQIHSLGILRSHKIPREDPEVLEVRAAHQQLKKNQILSNEIWHDVLVSPAPSDLLDTPDQFEVKNALSEKRKNILYMGPLHQDQGQHVLLQILKMYLDHVDKNTRLILIGTGSRAYQKKLMGLCLELSLKVASGFAEKYADRADVIFANAPNSQTLATVYRHAQLFALASETLVETRSLIDAFVFGVPVVAFNEAVTEALLGPENGLLIPCNEPISYLEAWSAVLNQENLSKKLRKASFERSSSFSEEAVGRAFDANLAKTLDAFQLFQLSQN